MTDHDVISFITIRFPADTRYILTVGGHNNNNHSSHIILFIVPYNKTMVLMLVAVSVFRLSSFFASVTGSSPPQLWPQGMYGLPQAKHGCPKNTNGFSWATGTIYQALNPLSTIPNHFHFQANATINGIARSFCIKNSTNIDKRRPVWPDGNYCVYMKSDQCPPGLQQGSLYWNDRLSNSNYQIGEVPRGIYLVNTLINFCCSAKGRASKPISLPNSEPFYLMTNYKRLECQDVRGTLKTLEYIKYDTVDGYAQRYPPHPYKMESNLMTVYYCYYTPCRWYMTALSGTIQSPHYPSNYPNNLDCQWRLEVPPNYHITLIFDVFVLETSPFSCNLGCYCDWLEVTIKRTSHTIFEKYCMEYLHAPPSRRNTYSNLVILDFHSNRDVNARGFRIRYETTLIREDSTTALPTSNLHTKNNKNNTTNTTTMPTRNTTTLAATTAATNTNTATANATDIPRTPNRSPFTDDTTTEHTVSSTVAKDERSTMKLRATVKIERETRTETSKSKTWIIALAVTLIAVGVLVAVGSLLYCRSERTAKFKRSLLSIRYSSDSSALGISRNSNTIDMYSGKDVEIIPESQLSDNPIYGSSVFLCSNDDTNNSKDDDDDKCLEKSVNPLYATPEDLKTDNPLYESVIIQKKTNDPKPIKSENPLYERIM